MKLLIAFLKAVVTIALFALVVWLIRSGILLLLTTFGPSIGAGIIVGTLLVGIATVFFYIEGLYK